MPMAIGRAVQSSGCGYDFIFRTPTARRVRLDKNRIASHLDAMQSQNPLIADFVKLANAAAGTFAGMTREARDAARERAREAFGGMDFVTREEFDAVKAMAARARGDAERLAERVAALEAKSQ